MSDVLKKLLKAAYGLSDEKITALLEKGDEDQAAEILQLDAARVAKFKDDATKAHDKGHAKAKAEVLTQREKELREKYSITDETLTGDALLDAITQTAAKAAGAGKLSDDAVKAHPLYVQLENEGKKAVKAAAKEWEDKYNSRENELATGERVGKATKAAFGLLDKANPVMPKNESVAGNLKDLYGKEFGKYDYDFAPDGTIIIKRPDGSVLEDAHGKRVAFEDFAKEKAGLYFEFAAATDRSSAGNGNGNNGTSGAGAGGSGNGGSSTVAKPTTLEELAKLIDDPAVDAATKAQYSAEFTAANP